METFWTDNEIKQYCEQVIAENPKIVAAYKAGKGLFGFFVGQVIKKFDNRIDPQTVTDILKKLLG